MLQECWTLTLTVPGRPPLILVVPEADQAEPFEIGLLRGGEPRMLRSGHLAYALRDVRADLEHAVRTALFRWEKECQREDAEVLDVAPDPAKPGDLGVAGGQLPPAQEGGPNASTR